MPYTDSFFLAVFWLVFFCLHFFWFACNKEIRVQLILTSQTVQTELHWVSFISSNTECYSIFFFARNGTSFRSLLCSTSFERTIFFIIPVFIPGVINIFFGTLSILLLDCCPTICLCIAGCCFVLALLSVTFPRRCWFILQLVHFYGFLFIFRVHRVLFSVSLFFLYARAAGGINDKV